MWASSRGHIVRIWRFKVAGTDALGSTIAALLGIYFVYKVYDSELFPAVGSWPPGVATAAALIAGDEGGAKARTLFHGILLGALGTALRIKPILPSGLPMAGVGIAFIANPSAMMALGVGLILRGYFPIFPLLCPLWE